MKHNRRDIQFLILVIIAVLGFSVAHAKSETRKPASVSSQAGSSLSSSSVQIWKTELQAFKSRHFVSLTAMKKSATDFQNKLADDETIRYEEKVSLRNQMYKLENQKASDFPAPQIVGFKKIPVDPTNPGRGFVLEPEYK